ncbi:hypothetical protein TrRE_jg9196, partial [Triparma retinervis]
AATAEAVSLTLPSIVPSPPSLDPTMLISQIKSLSSVLPTSAYLDVLAVAERVLVRKFFTTPSGLGGSVAVKVGRSTAWSDLVMV